MRAGWTKRAGDVTVEIFEKKLTKLSTRSIPTIVLVLTMLGNDHRRFYVVHHDDDDDVILTRIKCTL